MEKLALEKLFYALPPVNDLTKTLKKSHKIYFEFNVPTSSAPSARWPPASHLTFFDRVNCTKLPEILKNIRVNCRARLLIRNLCLGHKVKLHLNRGETESVKITRGLRPCQPYYATYMEDV